MSDLKSRIAAKMSGPTLAGLATITPEGKPWVRYVTVHCDPDLTIRFATFLGSRKVAHIRRDPAVHLVLGVGDPTTAESYVQAAGRAEIKTDPSAKQAHWSDALGAYFKGPDDPNYAVVEIRPERIEFYRMGQMQPEVWEA